MALLVTQEEKDPQERKACKACWVYRGPSVTRESAGSRVQMESGV